MSEAAEVLFELAQVSVHASARSDRVVLLRDIDMVVRAGERVAILGANGAGKSTLLRALHGLIPVASGRARIVPATEQAMLFQRAAHLKRSALENVAFALRSRGLASDAAHSKAQTALAACGIDALADRYARSLSGGEQQVLALARARALAPRALLADEPTSSLAPAATHAVERLLRAMCDEGATLVFATHNRGQAKRLSTRVIFMHEGRIAEDCSTEQFFANAKSQAAIDYLNVERV